MNITIIILLVFNLVLSSIIISWHFFKSQYVKKEKKEEEKEEEPNKDTPIKYVWSAIRIDGKLFNDRKAVAEKLGISRSTLDKWNREGILYEKFKEYNIDYKKILGIKEVKEFKEEPVNEVVKEKQGRPAKGYNAGLRGKKNKQRIRITSTMPPKILVKYGLKVNDEFDSFKNLREYIGVETQTVYNWHSNHWVEEIR